MSDKRKEKSAAGNEAVPCSNSRLYTIKPGDTLFLIAKRFNVSLASLRDCNPQIADPNVIYPGQVIVVPAPGNTTADRLGPVPFDPCQNYRGGPPPPAPLPAATCPDGQIYRVVCGDTMFKIAQQFGVSLDALVQANPQIDDPNLIYPGQEICVPGVAGVGAGGETPCINGFNYTIIAGDTMFDIARRNRVMLSDLIAANPQITDPDRIYPGQVICIPYGAAVMPEPPELPAQLLPPTPMPVAPPIPPEPPARMPPPCPPPARPMPRLHPPVCPVPRPCPPSRPLPRPCPMERPPRPMPPPSVQTPVYTAPGAPMTGERPPMYPMPVYVVVPWDECPYRPKDKGKKCKSRKHDRKKRRCY
jgi:spore coat assembly protein SafA